MKFDEKCAERIRLSIISSFTYDDIENETGISVSSLKRIASGERDPKLTEIRKIAKATGKNPVWLAFGNIEIVDANLSRLPNFNNSDSEQEEIKKLLLITDIKDLDNEQLDFVSKIIELVKLKNTIDNLAERKMTIGFDNTHGNK